MSFDKTGSGLILKEGFDNFEVAGADKVFNKANAKIIGQTIEVQSDEQSTPVAVRYAFKNYMHGNLFNKEGLPGVPFRTDKWKP